MSTLFGVAGRGPRSEWSVKDIRERVWKGSKNIDKQTNKQRMLLENEKKRQR
jgi:hypothetical protein